jgi:putative aminopeptidase FrvX
MKILKEMCSLPTAPFAEQHVIDYARRFARQRPKLILNEDRQGNVMLQLPGRTKQPRWVFTAHMDHPGFVADRMLDRRTLQAHFRGWVAIDFVRGTRVRFFSDGQEITGRVIEASCEIYDRLDVPDRVKVRVAAPVEPGSAGMFDQGEAKVKGRTLYSRACDDLAGAAAALTMLDELLRKPPKVPVAVLLTRAEEEGFIGAIAAAQKPQLLRKSDRIIAIETSAMQPYAPQGKGAIIRIGDKSSIFNSSLSYYLTEQAAALAKQDRKFSYLRALMPGGTCEATVFDVYGYHTGSICIALGNYHNMDRDRQKIGPEYVSVDDWQSMVKLFVAVVRNGHTYDAGHGALKQRIEKRFARLKHLL